MEITIDETKALLRATDILTIEYSIRTIISLSSVRLCLRELPQYVPRWRVSANNVSPVSWAEWTIGGAMMSSTTESSCSFPNDLLCQMRIMMARNLQVPYLSEMTGGSREAGVIVCFYVNTRTRYVISWGINHSQLYLAVWKQCNSRQVKVKGLQRKLTGFIHPRLDSILNAPARTTTGKLCDDSQ